MVVPELGLSTCLFRRFLPRKHLPLLAANGIALTELSVNCFDILEDKARTADLKRALSDSAVRVHSVHVPYREEFDLSNPDPRVRQNGIDAALLCLDRLIAFGGRYLVLHPNNGRLDNDEDGVRRHLSLESMRTLARRLGDASPKLAIENMVPGYLCKTTEHLVSFLDALADPRFGICLDVNHINLTEDILQATARCGPRILTVHISDNDGVDERHWIPGSGLIPWKAWVKALRAAGYAGPFMCEVGSPRRQRRPLPESKTVAAVRRSAGELLLAGEPA